MKKNKCKINLLLLVCLISLFLVIFSCSFFFKTDVNFDFETLDNVSFSYYIDGVLALQISDRLENMVFDETSSCSDGVSVSWDYKRQGVILSGNPKTKTRCKIKLKNKYVEEDLNGTAPILQDPLLPVVIENDGTVRKADLASEWYNYANKIWANVVILKDESREYKNNEVIPEENIESYFVWIPSYSYQLWDLENYDGLVETEENKEHEIQIKFGMALEMDNELDCLDSSTCQVGEDYMHPAFAFNEDIMGFWVGKFETSKGNGVEDNSINPSGVEIKPNVVSWRNIQVSQAFYTSYQYKRSLESHMMKNTEWGAVAYLSHSKYGSMASVRFNNNSDSKTGYASVTEPTCGYTADNRDCNKYGNTSDVTLPYNTTTGYLASTTGNISGIYDMSGGAWEYVMAVMADQDGNPLSGASASSNSGFLGGYGLESGTLTNGYPWPRNQYYDKYLYGTSDVDYSHRILGDATGEMGPFHGEVYSIDSTRFVSSWYDDVAFFVSNRTPWVVRGGRFTHGSDAGIFSFSNETGLNNKYKSFRVVLAPTK